MVSAAERAGGGLTVANPRGLALPRCTFTSVQLLEASVPILQRSGSFCVESEVKRSNHSYWREFQGQRWKLASINQLTVYHYKQQTQPSLPDKPQQVRISSVHKSSLNK